MIERVVARCSRSYRTVLLIAAATTLFAAGTLGGFGLDLLPPLGDRQLIVRATWPRSPELVDSQVTGPLVSTLLGSAGVRAVRGQSETGAAVVHVLLDDNVSQDAGRTQVLARLTQARAALPRDAMVELATEASSLGWVFEYVVTDTSGTRSVGEIRRYQDAYLDPALTAVPGVAEVASVGGPREQYRANVDPARLTGYRLSIQQVIEALRLDNLDADGGVIVSAGAEVVVRGRSALRTMKDIGDVVVAAREDGTTVLVKDLAVVSREPEYQRGVADLGGNGDTVTGIVIASPGENALAVVERVKRRLDELRSSLPPGLEVKPVYDRSELINAAVRHAVWTLASIIATVALVIFVFLRHPASAVVSIITIPAAAILALAACRLLGVDLNVMSLGGLSLAIGALVDASIVVAEQAYRSHEEGPATRPATSTAEPSATSMAESPVASVAAGHLEAAAQAEPVDGIAPVVRAGFLSLMVIAVSFLPILALPGDEGRLFRPMVYAKSASIAAAAMLLLTLDPALRVALGRRPGRRTSSPAVEWISDRYASIVDWALSHRRLVLTTPVVLALLSLPAWMSLGSELLPPINEGTLLYMPTTAPGIAADEAMPLLQRMDTALAGFPEVAAVLGKAGRAETATDTAPLSMFETLVVLKPEAEWRPRDTWYSSWAPAWLRPLLRWTGRDRISRETLVAEMDAALTIPGLVNAWTMPIRGRLDMLATGIRTPLGIKVTGADPRERQRLGEEIQRALSSLAATRSAFVETTGESQFVDVEWDLAALGREGITLDEAQTTIAAVGGVAVTTVAEDRTRFPVVVRFGPGARADATAIARLPVTSKDGQRNATVSAVGTVRRTTGPAMLRYDDGFPVTYMFVDVSGDIGTYVDAAETTIRQNVRMPAGYDFVFAGQYEAISRTRSRLWGIIPATLALVFALIQISTRSFVKASMVVLAVPFSLIGAGWLLWLLDYQLSAAVWVGIVVLLGVDAETAVFMLLYLEQAYTRPGAVADDGVLRQRIIAGAARRLRPKVMTITALIAGLLPLMWADGPGSEVMKRVAAPVLGGIVTSFGLELLVFPVLFHAWRSRSLPSPDVAG